MLRSAVTHDEYATSHTPRAVCRSILMVGTDSRGKGGISAVISGYLEGGLFDRFPIEYVVTHRTGGAWTKIAAAMTGWARVAVLLRRLDAPLVHIQTASRASFWRKAIVCQMARWAGRPYILHVHGGEFLHFYRNESGPLVRSWIRSVLRNADLVIALSETSRGGLQELVPSARIDVLANAVALPELRQLRPAAEREPTILFLGDISRSKGVHDLISAFARIAGTHAGPKLVFGGVGATTEVGERAAALGIAARVACTGWMNAAAKREALASAAMLVLPSYAENLPMSLLEAMSWGVPVVATRVGGIPQLIQHGANGLLVSPGDVEGLTQAIDSLVTNAALRDRLGRAGRATIEASYTADAMLARLGQIYGRFGLEARAQDAR